jgi:phasin family protein
MVTLGSAGIVFVVPHKKCLTADWKAVKFGLLRRTKRVCRPKFTQTIRRNTMFSTADQFSNATKASIDAQIAAMNDFANKTLHSMAELVELNIATAKASLEHSSAAAQQILSAKDPQEILTLTSSQAQPNAEKVIAYGRHVASIATRAQAEFTKVTEARISETSRQVNKLIDDLSKAAPAGTENAVSMLKAGVANANATYEQIVKVGKQAAETMEDSMNEASKHFVPAAEKPARSKKH